MSGRTGRAGDDERPTIGLRLFGFVLIACGLLCLVRVTTGQVEGDWRSDVLWSGLGLPLALAGLALNGWALAFCAALAWTFPATILFGGLVVLVDPGYASFLDSTRHPVGSGWQARGLGVLFTAVGAAGLAGYYHLVRAARRR
ncbi:hypothetical protein F8568_036450 [Actinomadura sp. LD22]|uniref:Uncharacterized protein n=1 Tax=Actinomadura physcomitrii TaxID=2650748 RepID=A0A6I4MTW0_9ACTN|nr:hypothetical protein [Actinomadura physcomitrii]MWA05756.1 hypothetical protein [Actinomadura physcomitrii]